jgi:hypothetical protein
MRTFRPATTRAAADIKGTAIAAAAFSAGTTRAALFGARATSAAANLCTATAAAAAVSRHGATAAGTYAVSARATVTAAEQAVARAASAAGDDHALLQRRSATPHVGGAAASGTRCGAAPSATVESADPAGGTSRAELPAAADENRERFSGCNGDRRLDLAAKSGRGATSGVTASGCARGGDRQRDNACRDLEGLLCSRICEGLTFRRRFRVARRTRACRKDRLHPKARREARKTIAARDE